MLRAKATERRRRAAAVCLALIWSALALQGQNSDPDSWNALGHLRRGRRVQIVDLNGRSHQGLFLGYSDQAISISVGREEVMVLREQIAMVKSSDSMGAWKAAYRPWASLGQLRSGQTIKVVRTGSREVTGEFVGYSNEVLELKAQQEHISVPREQVRKVTLIGHSHVEEGAAIGAVIGSLGAVLLGSVACGGPGATGNHEAIGSMAPAGGALAGAAIGALITSHQTIYRADAKAETRPPK